MGAPGVSEFEKGVQLFVGSRRLAATREETKRFVGELKAPYFEVLQ